MKYILKTLITLLLLSSISFSNSFAQDTLNTENNLNAQEKPDRMVHFKGRSVDLEPYVEGFPYRGFKPFYAANKLYYYKKGDALELLELELSGKPDLSKGKKISDIDFSKRNVWGIRYNENDNYLYWNGDVKNDEVINLTRLNTETGETEKLTDVPYIFGYRWNNDQTQIAYVSRLGTKENRLGELVLLDLNTKKETKIIQDNADMRFTWGSPSWQPEEKGLVLSAYKNAQRTNGNLVYVDFENRSQTILTDTAIKRSGVYVYEEWLDKETFLYASNEDGFNNVYSYNLPNKKATKLTHFTNDITSSELLTINNRKYLFATTYSPIESQLYLLDIATGEIVLQQQSDLVIDTYDADMDKMMVSASSNSSLFRIDEVQVSTDAFTFKTVVDVPETLKKKVYKAIPERITYPTFDIDEQTDKQRELHAYLYKPTQPVDPENQIVLIESFYGGGNYFNMRNQILADAGIYVLSPSPRGSRGFGKAFSDLNNKDLGGNEIIDIFYAAQYISEKLNIPPQNIGVFGGSHGGYATMRTLTFPEEVNGNKASFDWGFGISHAGFSDIIHFYEHCNIPDWVTLEAGDPATEADKLNDRSPLYHAEKMKGHLLLTHGVNDSRVPIEGSRMMADSLKKYNKNVQLVEFEGQGHGIKGLENTVTNYQTWFDFLEKVTK